MTRNERLRKRALQLIQAGVTQKTISDAMGMKTGTFSKWVRGLKGIKPASVDAADGFEALVAEMQKTLNDISQETQRADATAGKPFSDPRRQSSGGGGPSERSDRQAG